MNRYSYSRHHRTYDHAKCMLDRLMAEGAILPEDDPRIVPYGARGEFATVINYAIDLVRR